MKLQFLESSFSVCRLAPDATIPGWAVGELVAIVRTADELTIIAPMPSVPEHETVERDYTCFRVVGTIEFDVIGVIASISRELADARIPLLAVSTFDTDYFFVKNDQRETTRQRLSNAGYQFVG